MAEAALELRAILEAAERAAAADDFLSAEQHLRQAAALQETQLGAGHPDLANTLNNLGIVCEHIGKPADAEACYRRAYRIASAALPADHPLVQTSGQNLRDFCEAIGKPFELSEAVPPELEPFAPEPTAPRPAPAPFRPAFRTSRSAPPPRPAAVARDPEPPAPAPPLRLATETRAPEPPPRQPTAATRTASPVSSPSSRPTTAIAIGAVLLVALGTWWFGFREPSRPTAPSSTRVETPAPREEPPPAAATAAPEPAPIPAAPATPPPVETPTEKPPTADSACEAGRVQDRRERRRVRGRSKAVSLADHVKLVVHAGDESLRAWRLLLLHEGAVAARHHRAASLVDGRTSGAKREPSNWSESRRRLSDVQPQHRDRRAARRLDDRVARCGRSAPPRGALHRSVDRTYCSSTPDSPSTKLSSAAALLLGGRSRCDLLRSRLCCFLLLARL